MFLIACSAPTVWDRRPWSRADKAAEQQLKKTLFISFNLNFLFLYNSFEIKTMYRFHYHEVGFSRVSFEVWVNTSRNGLEPLKTLSINHIRPENQKANAKRSRRHQSIESDRICCTTFQGYAKLMHKCFNFLRINWLAQASMKRICFTLVGAIPLVPRAA